MGQKMVNMEEKILIESGKYYVCIGIPKEKEDITSLYEQDYTSFRTILEKRFYFRKCVVYYSGLDNMLFDDTHVLRLISDIDAPYFKEFEFTIEPQVKEMIKTIKEKNLYIDDIKINPYFFDESLNISTYVCRADFNSGKLTKNLSNHIDVVGLSQINCIEHLIDTIRKRMICRSKVSEAVKKIIFRTY